MTWLKLSDNYSDGTQHLSDAAFRAHVEALLWVMRREQGPVLTHRDVRRALDTDNGEEAVTELVACGFWREVPSGYEVCYHMEHQPEPEVIAARRANDAERQRRRRLRSARIDDDSAPIRPPITARPAPSRPDPTRPDPGHADGHGGSHAVTGVRGHRDGCDCARCSAARSWGEESA